MTNITFNITSNTLLFACSGHAGYAEHGQDIVCASASILAYTIAQCIENMQTEGKLKRIDEMSIQDGAVTVVCTPKEEHRQEVIDIYLTVRTGFELLAHNFPQYVEFNSID